MATYLTLNQFERIMKNWAINDPNIKGAFGYGPLWGENGKPKVDQKYPALYVVPEQSLSPQNEVRRTFKFIFYDLVWQQDNTQTMKSNLSDVHSDTEQMCFRLRRWFDGNDQADYFEVLNVPDIRPFQDKWLDAVAGQVMTIELSFNDITDCEDPENVLEY